MKLATYLSLLAAMLYFLAGGMCLANDAYLLGIVWITGGGFHCGAAYFNWKAHQLNTETERLNMETELLTKEMRGL